MTTIIKEFDPLIQDPETLEQQFGVILPRVMSPSANGQPNEYALTSFGSKLEDKTLADVWRIFFEKKLNNIHPYLHLYYRLNISDFEARLDLSSSKKIEAANLLVYHMEQLLNYLFVSNVDSWVISCSSLENSPIAKSDILNFFQCEKPSEKKFEKRHAMIAEFLHAEERNMSSSVLKRFMLQSYKKSNMISISMTLINEGYSSSELERAFTDFNKEPLTHIPNLSEEEATFRVAFRLQAILDDIRQWQTPRQSINLAGRKRNNKPAGASKKSDGKIVCYRCNERGHKSPQCNKI